MVKTIDAFQANDGTVFTSLDACQKHEARKDNFSYYIFQDERRVAFEDSNYMKRYIIICENIGITMLYSFLFKKFGNAFFKKSLSVYDYESNWTLFPSTENEAMAYEKEMHSREKKVDKLFLSISFL
jgi:hypothetical protein